MKVCQLGLLFILALCSMPTAAQTKPVILGTTSYVSNGNYHPLDGVEVTVYRKAPVKQVTSHDGGKFTVTFSAGLPVSVLFRGPDNSLPALQSLSAGAGTEQLVHVAVFTIQEARRQGINIPHYIQSIISRLEAVGVNPKDPQIQALSVLLKKFV